MIRTGLRFGISASPFYGADIGLFIAKYDERGAMRLHAAHPEFVESDGIQAEPTLRLTGDEAQELADRLWDAGVRPTQSKQGQGMFEAQGRHLDDMRALVFKIPMVTVECKK